MTKEQKTICSLLANALFQKERKAEPDVSWMGVYEECIRQTIPAAIVSVIPPEAPFDVRMKWINAAGINAVSNQRVEDAHFAIHELLEKNGVPYTILKGMATQSYYPDPSMRTLGDVDFLVKEEDAERCSLLLQDNGYIREEHLLPYEWGYQKNSTEFELHLAINGVPEGKAGEETRRLLADMIETSSVSECFPKPLMLPDDFHHGLVILLHTAKHMVSEGVGFRQICDWAVFVSHLGEDFPERFELPLKKIGLWNYALILSAVCSAYIGMPCYSWIPEYDPAFLETVMDDLVRAGNFQRDADTGVNAILVEKTDVGGAAQGSMLKQLMKNLGQKTKYKWPVMNRAKVLIPFGVCVMGVQYTAGMISGKYKRIDPKALVNEAQGRRQLYEAMELFQDPEETR